MSHADDPEVNDLYACQRLIKELRADLEKETKRGDVYRDKHAEMQKNWYEHFHELEQQRIAQRDELIDQRDTALAALEKERERAQKMADERAGFKDVAQSLESRYTALEKAAREYITGAGVTPNIPLYTLFAALKEAVDSLTPKEGE